MRALALAVELKSFLFVRVLAECGVWRGSFRSMDWLVLQASGTQLEQQEPDQHAKHKQVTRAQ